MIEEAAEPEAGDAALSVIVPAEWAEAAGAVLMEVFGPFEECPTLGTHGEPGARLVFYPGEDHPGFIGLSQDGLTPNPPLVDRVLALLPLELAGSGRVKIENAHVPRDWVDGWKEHFRPTVIGRVCIRPPWEAPLPACNGGGPGAGAGGGGSHGEDLVEVVINPGLGFGTGLHPTTRGTLSLLQTGSSTGRLLDAGTGSGVLAIAAAKLGWGPIVAFDNDPVALTSAAENLELNGVADIVYLVEAGVEAMRPEWSQGATVLANMTLEPVLTLLGRLTATGDTGKPCRLVVSGILAGAQERQLLRAASQAGFASARRVYEAEWVTLEMLPVLRSEE